VRNSYRASVFQASLIVLVSIATAQICVPAALAQETVLYSFNDTTGNVPFTGVTLDKSGNVYGTTAVGGNLSLCLTYGCGVVYEIVHNSDGTWTNRTIYEFAGGSSDGAFPDGTLTFDSRGHIFGTTYYGGNGSSCNQGEFPGCGTVFELVHNPTGGWTESVIYNFQGGNDGAWPESNVIVDAQGNLYGTTSYGGSTAACVPYSAPTGCGIVFELSPNGSGGWTESVLYAFKGGMDGLNPFGGVIFDGAGSLFGTTDGGGLSCSQYQTGSDCGSVFKLRRTTTGWVKSTPYRFKGGTDGFGPEGNLAVDASGNLYGTTYFGGITAPKFGNGTVYELTPNGSGGWTETVLYRFTGLLDGGYPPAGVVFDAAGNMYGLTYAGGTSGQDSGGGTAFELSPSSTGWTETTLASFQTLDGGELPYGGATLDSSGNLYGTLHYGGTVSTSCPDGCGVVFEVPAP
jgi:uncharacterized repeat protein (TIGR03803 family)